MSFSTYEEFVSWLDKSEAGFLEKREREAPAINFLMSLDRAVAEARELGDKPISLVLGSLDLTMLQDANLLDVVFRPDAHERRYRNGILLLTPSHIDHSLSASTRVHIERNGKVIDTIFANGKFTETYL